MSVEDNYYTDLANLSTPENDPPKMTHREWLIRLIAERLTPRAITKLDQHALQDLSLEQRVEDIGAGIEQEPACWWVEQKLDDIFSTPHRKTLFLKAVRRQWLRTH